MYLQILTILQAEYIVSDELTPRVLTDDATFSFELGIAKVGLFP